MKSDIDLWCCALLSKFVLCSHHQAVPHSVGLRGWGWSIKMQKSQTIKKKNYIETSSCHSVILYPTSATDTLMLYHCHFVKHFVLLMSVSWRFQRHLKSYRQWSDRQLSSSDIAEAMISCDWFRVGWLIRYSLLLWPPVEVTSRVFADYICLFILSQIQIS